MSNLTISGIIMCSLVAYVAGLIWLENWMQKMFFSAGIGIFIWLFVTGLILIFVGIK